MNRSDLIAKLDALRECDPGLAYFGAKAHQYRLNPPLAEDIVAAIEARYRFTLPAEYREFVTVIGNGGAGPYYGVFPLGQQHSPRELAPWNETVGDVSRPFPHAAAWNLPPEFWAQQPDPPDGTPIEEEDRMNQEWDKKLVERYWLTSLVDGAIPITDMGCAMGNILIVTGPLAGTVWQDLRSDYNGIVPVAGDAGRPLTFDEWYMKWLDEGLAKYKEHPSQPRVISAPQPWWRKIFGDR